MQCRIKMEGDPRQLKKFQREGIDPERKLRFGARIAELLAAGLTHRDIVQQLVAENIKTGAGNPPTIVSVRNQIMRLKKTRARA